MAAARGSSEGVRRSDAIVARRRRDRMRRYGLYLLAFVILAWVFHSTVVEATDWGRIGSLGSVLETLGRFLPPDLSLAPQLVQPMIETFMMALLGTLLGAFLSVPVIWLGAYNIAPFAPVSYAIGRGLMTVSRSVHELVWALIFVAAVGLGALPGILAVAFRSIGFIAKITAEAIENIDRRSLEAIYAAGGNRLQVLRYAVMPQVLPTFTSVVIFEWDINIRRASIMGLVGAGGLGLTFYRQMAMFNYAGVTSVIVAILVLIGIGEVVSYLLRRRMI